MAKSKNDADVQIDITGKNENLNESLKDSESVISSFGRKVSKIFTSVSSVANSLKENIVNTFVNSAQSVQDFTDNINQSSLAVKTFNSLWSKSKSFLASYSLELNETILLHKDLAKANRLVANSSGYATGSLQKYAEYLEKITAFSANATESAIKLMMHFRNIHGDEFLRATRASQDLAQELRIDLNSAAQLVAESLSDPINAINKLSSANVFFTENEKKMIQKMMDANKVVAAQQIVLRRLEISFGGAAKAAGETFYGKLQRLKNILTTIGTTIGEKVISKFNQIFDTTSNGKKIFDILLQKIDQFGKITIAVVDKILPKIIDLTKNIRINFEQVYDWLIDQTINIFSGAQVVVENFGEVFTEVNRFIFRSIQQIWNGISLIFTDIIPKSYNYLVDVISNMTGQLYNNWKILSLNLQLLFGNLQTNFYVMLQDISAEIAKFGIKLMKWGTEGLINLAAWATGLGPIVRFTLGNIIGEVGDWAENKVDKLIDDMKTDYVDMFEGLHDLPGFENPFKNVETPDFEDSFFWLKRSFNLSQQWDDLLQGMSTRFGDKFHSNVTSNRKAFDQFMQDVKNRSSEMKDIFEPPDMKKIKDRMKDNEEKKKSSLANSVRGLEEFWYKGSSEISKNTKAIEENTKEQKKKSLKEIREEHKKTANKAREDRRQQALLAKGKKPEIRTEEDIKKKDEEKAKKREENIRRVQDISIQRMNAAFNKWVKGGMKGENPAARALRLDAERDQKKAERAEALAKIKEQRKVDKEGKYEAARARSEETIRKSKERLAAKQQQQNNQEFNNSSRRTSNISQKDKKQLNQENVNMKLAFKDANKDVVSELKGIHKNTKGTMKVSVV